MVFRTAFHRVSSHQTRDPEYFTDSSNIPWNPPSIFHPDLIATVPQMSLPSFCALLSQQSHLFLICVVLTYNDSRIILHKMCQILKNYQCNWLLASTSDPGASLRFFWVSWEVFVLHGYDCNHWVAKSCTTTAYRWLLRDSLPSLRTLWPASC